MFWHNFALTCSSFSICCKLVPIICYVHCISKGAGMSDHVYTKYTNIERSLKEACKTTGRLFHDRSLCRGQLRCLCGSCCLLKQKYDLQGRGNIEEYVSPRDPQVDPNWFSKAREACNLPVLSFDIEGILFFRWLLYEEYLIVSSYHIFRSQSLPLRWCLHQWLEMPLATGWGLEILFA